MASKMFSYVFVMMAAMALMNAVNAHTFGGASVDVTEANFKSIVLDSDSLVLTVFYAPWCGHCKNLAPEWTKAANVLKGVATLAAVDMTQHQSVGAPYGISGYPTIKVFGANKKSPHDYSGARTSQGIVDAVLSEIKKMTESRSGKKSSGGGGGSGNKSGSDVVELTDASFKDTVVNSNDIWIVAFTAPWCGHCKSLHPAWETAATELKGKVKLGNVDATVHQGISSTYGVSGYPTIKVFNKGQISDYEGGRQSSDIVAAALSLYEENAEPPSVDELVASSVWDGSCTTGKTCIVAILPHILDSSADDRNRYLGILQLLAEKNRRKPFTWLWAEAGSQPEVEASFEVGGYGYPAVVAVNSSKKKFASQKGSFTESALSEFLVDLVKGRHRLGSVKAMPSIKDISPWDGLDGVLTTDEVSLDELFKEEL